MNHAATGAPFDFPTGSAHKLALLKRFFWITNTRNNNLKQRVGRYQEYRSPISERKELVKRILSAQKSQALVEFALVSPLFLLVVFSAIDIGRLLYAYTAISSAARDGARTASLSASIFSDCQIIQELELVGQGFPLKMDPNSLVGNSDPNNPAGTLRTSTPPPNTAYGYIWPAVATANPPDNNCNSSQQRAISPTVKQVAVAVQYHFIPLLPMVSTFAPDVIVKTVSVVTTE